MFRYGIFPTIVAKNTKSPETNFFVERDITDTELDNETLSFFHKKYIIYHLYFILNINNHFHPSSNLNHY